MWKREPDAELVEGWIERALQLVEEGSRNQARELYALSGWKEDEASARALQAVAERLGDTICARLRWRRSTMPRRQPETSPGPMPWRTSSSSSCPSSRARTNRTRALLHVVLVYLNAGDLPAAARAAALHVELAEGLTPHHRLHGIALRILVETLQAPGIGGASLLGSTRPRPSARAAELRFPAVKPADFLSREEFERLSEEDAVAYFHLPLRPGGRLLRCPTGRVARPAAASHGAVRGFESVRRLSRFVPALTRRRSRCAEWDRTLLVLAAGPTTVARQLVS
jgi:hypothetical protein